MQELKSHFARRPSPSAKVFAEQTLVEFALRGVVFLHHATGHESIFIFRNNHFVGAGIAHGLGIALLASTGNNLDLWVQGFGGDGDVRIIGVVINDDAKAPRARAIPAVCRMS